ncbi:hypothetical protein [Microbispora bryophytorum]|uniref:Uncharacterized protein n=1 Tax=Microbispora bryophytorum subsp. camponoti TaxID=1677852 RepID=A0ABR8KVK7_9ACTN|nr:hypothetical protein [Microbispora camponoti]MBD3142001.1 hypothetical protein [Microbispora camponoti]
MDSSVATITAPTTSSVISGDGNGTLVAGAAQEGIDLSFNSGLDNQPGTETSDVLDDRPALDRRLGRS